jgi:hypothetical protein
MTAKIISLKTNRGKAPQRKLGTHGRRLWDSVHEEVVLEDAGGLELLLGACQALDRAESCREQIDRMGEIIKTKTGVRENPLLKNELANRAFVARSIGRLGLDVEGVKALGRPPARGYEGE